MPESVTELDSSELLANDARERGADHPAGNRLLRDGAREQVHVVHVSSKRNSREVKTLEVMAGRVLP